MDRLWIGLGALTGLLAVAMAAVAAHALPAGTGEATRRMMDSALRMQGWHALALLACGLWADRGGRLVHLAGAAFTLGILLFCGAVYALALGAAQSGTTAPAGGTLLMLGWLLLGLSALRAR